MVSETQLKSSVYLVASIIKCSVSRVACIPHQITRDNYHYNYTYKYNMRNINCKVTELISYVIGLFILTG